MSYPQSKPAIRDLQKNLLFSIKNNKLSLNFYSQNVELQQPDTFSFITGENRFHTTKTLLDANDAIAFAVIILNEESQLSINHTQRYQLIACVTQLLELSNDQTGKQAFQDVLAKQFLLLLHQHSALCDFALKVNIKAKTLPKLYQPNLDNIKRLLDANSGLVRSILYQGRILTGRCNQLLLEQADAVNRIQSFVKANTEKAFNRYLEQCFKTPEHKQNLRQAKDATRFYLDQSLLDGTTLFPDIHGDYIYTEHTYTTLSYQYAVYLEKNIDQVNEIISKVKPFIESFTLFTNYLSKKHLAFPAAKQLGDLQQCIYEYSLRPSPIISVMLEKNFTSAFKAQLITHLAEKFMYFCKGTTSPLEFAINDDCPEMADLLLELGCETKMYKNSNNFLSTAIKHYSTDMVNVLAKHGLALFEGKLNTLSLRPLDMLIRKNENEFKTVSDDWKKMLKHFFLCGAKTNEELTGNQGCSFVSNYYPKKYQQCYETYKQFYRPNNLLKRCLLWFCLADRYKHLPLDIVKIVLTEVFQSNQQTVKEALFCVNFIRMIKNHHENEEKQHAFDKRFGLTIYRGTP